MKQSKKFISEYHTALTKSKYSDKIKPKRRINMVQILER